MIIMPGPANLSITASRLIGLRLGHLAGLDLLVHALVCWSRICWMMAGCEKMTKTEIMPTDAKNQRRHQPVGHCRFAGFYLLKNFTGFCEDIEQPCRK